uniref:C-X-C motif chemokine n=1 Tax=Salvator merianae TaxID=96440 RepID=A0A8D0C9Y1_SALMN
MGQAAPYWNKQPVPNWGGFLLEWDRAIPIQIAWPAPALAAAFGDSSEATLRGCKCLKNTSSAFSPKQIKSLQVIPSGIRCQNTEIILTLRNNWKVCVNPKVMWVKELIKQDPSF